MKRLLWRSMLAPSLPRRSPPLPRALLSLAFLPSCTAFHPHPSPRRLSPPLPCLPRHACFGRPLVTAAASSTAESSYLPPVPLLPPPSLPNGTVIRKFALPALLLWIGSPVLSLIDTSAVGLSAPLNQGATQLASLGPSTTFCDGTSYLFAFLNVATTNLYAAEAAKVANAPTSEEKEAAKADAEEVVRIGARLALLSGLLAASLLSVFAPPLLRLYVGAGAAANSAMLSNAISYVRIRIFSLPFALLGNVLQSALLGARDSITPVLALLLSAIVNVVADGLCVVGFKQGVPGAALATSFAQLVATLALLRAAARRLLPIGGFGGFGRRLSSGSPRASVFLKFAAPVLTLILGKIVCFGFMTRAAAGLGEVSLACHQLTLSAFFFLSPMLEVISQTAQSFLPEYASPPRGADMPAWRAASDRLAMRLLRLATLVGLFAASLGFAFPLLGAHLVTNDAVVLQAMKPLALPLCVAVTLTGPVCASEGVLLARRQLKFLSFIYLTSVALLPAFLLRVSSVTDVWNTFAVFQLVRAVSFTARVWLPVLLGKLRRRRD